MSSFIIREITPDDADSLMLMINELAEYEKMPSSVVNTAEKIQNHIKDKIVRGFIALDGETPAGMNLYYISYSTWVGPFIHMEDLYVRPQYRKKQLGKQLFQTLAKEAVAKGYSRIEWAVLDWNETAIKFYNQTKYSNLTKEEGWYTFRLSDGAIEEFANHGQ